MNTKYESCYTQIPIELNFTYRVGLLVHKYRMATGKNPTELHLNRDTFILLKHEVCFYIDSNFADVNNKFLGLDIIIKEVDGNNKFNIYYEVK